MRGTETLIRFDSVKYKVTSKELPVIRSAITYAVIAPSQPPILFSFGNLKNSPNSIGLAGQSSARKVMGRVKIPIKQQLKITVAKSINA